MHYKCVIVQFRVMLIFNFYNLVNLCGEDFTDVKNGIKTATLIESKKLHSVTRTC